MRSLCKQILLDGGGLVVTLTDEPSIDSDGLPKIFDWTIMESAIECSTSGNSDWPSSQGSPIVAVGFSGSLEKIPANRRNLWETLLQKELVQLVLVEEGLRVGGVLRQRQAVFGDILVTIGGGPGVDHLALLYSSNHKPVIPLDLKFGKPTVKKTASEKLSTLALQNPSAFFETDKPQDAASAYSLLKLAASPQEEVEFERRFFHFVTNLSPPKSFFARLLDHASDQFVDVEFFFRQVVDPVVADLQLERYEAGTDVASEPFLNLEIFRRLSAASLIIVDLTQVRPNCLIELGYALGNQKKVIMTAKEGTRLPFDASSIPCFFWNPSRPASELQHDLREFMRVYINRGNVVTTDALGVH